MSSKPMTTKTDIQFWDRRRGIIRTQKGGWIIGQGVFNHGYSMLDDLVGHASFSQVLILNVTGRLPERRLADWLEAAFICLSWPDPRIWCNQIGALGGTTRTSPVAAITAGILASDSRLYGPGTVLGAAEFITNALKKSKAGFSVEDIITEQCRSPGAKPSIVGYARPIATGDERVVAMERVANELGFEIGEHLSLAHEIEQALLNRYDESMNLAGYLMAFLCDQDFTAKEMYRLFSLCVNSGVHACYAEAYDLPQDAFLPMCCDDIDYRGKPPRPIE